MGPIVSETLAVTVEGTVGLTRRAPTDDYAPYGPLLDDRKQNVGTDMFNFAGVHDAGHTVGCALARNRVALSCNRVEMQAYGRQRNAKAAVTRPKIKHKPRPFTSRTPRNLPRVTEQPRMRQACQEARMA